jgi:hypothetical protein
MNRQKEETNKVNRTKFNKLQHNASLSKKMKKLKLKKL